ncbi:unnamed protein product, partial [Coregonus sp. 'balchen']
PPPPEGVVISEVGGARWTNHSQQRGFVELLGPPLTSLQGLVLTVFEEYRAGTTMALPLTGITDHNGFYLIGNITGADQVFPKGATIPANGAVVLCSDTVTVCRAGTTLTNSTLRDTLVFSDDLRLLIKLSATRGQQVMPVLRSVEDSPVSLSRCSCCEARSPSSWTSSSPTPRLTNICPSPAFSSDLDLCLAPLSGDWQEHPGSKPCDPYFLGNWAFRDVKKGEASMTAVDWCRVTVRWMSLAIWRKDVTVGSLPSTCRALSDHQRALILQTSPTQGDTCTNPATDRRMSTGALLLLGLGAALFTYFYKKRQPLDYYSMELNEPEEGPSEL